MGIDARSFDQRRDSSFDGFAGRCRNERQEFRADQFVGRLPPESTYASFTNVNVRSGRKRQINSVCVSTTLRYRSSLSLRLVQPVDVAAAAGESGDERHLSENTALAPTTYRL